ncbi:hypothetical protein SAE02_61160 [Skermanella aerolata]|uniref:Uncharacterized protein n=1 Tax=Skermanella aerolata TaxID=393310 RepID=A0A512DZP7_9PROT|nr:hypothetical protein SAE02_61160 [Skermanella aerolata]
MSGIAIGGIIGEIVSGVGGAMRERGQGCPVDTMLACTMAKGDQGDKSFMRSQAAPGRLERTGPRCIPHNMPEVPHLPSG